MKHKTSELTGALLDAAVAKALCADGDPIMVAKYGCAIPLRLGVCIVGHGMTAEQYEEWNAERVKRETAKYELDMKLRELGFHPSTNWEIGGPIIERERIVLQPLYDDTWESAMPVESWPHSFDGQTTPRISGPTPLISSMRAYVASKLGDEVEL